jgi:hypothetical protein
MSQKFILEISDHIDTEKSFCIRRGLSVQLPRDWLPPYGDTTYNGTSLQKISEPTITRTQLSECLERIESQELTWAASGEPNGEVKISAVRSAFEELLK